MPKIKRPLEQTPHTWMNGPDGYQYHCVVCGISKCEDHDGWNTCESWSIERTKRMQSGMYSLSSLAKMWRDFYLRKP